MLNTEKYLTTRQAASLLGVTTQAVGIRIRTGRLRSIKPYSETLVLKVDVEKWQAERRKRMEEQPR